MCKLRAFNKICTIGWVGERFWEEPSGYLVATQICVDMCKLFYVVYGGWFEVLIPKGTREPPGYLGGKKKLHARCNLPVAPEGRPILIPKVLGRFWRF
jgi:hypothetical protein